MRNSVIFVGLGVALAAGTSVARAQTVETIVTPAAGPAVVAQAPVAVPPSGVLLPPASTVAVTAPVETVETVRTVTTTEPRRVHRRAVHPRTVDRVTTVTRTTTVRPGVVAAAPAYDELMRGPRLYDVVTPAPAAAPAVQPASRRAGRWGDDGDRGADGDAGLSVYLPTRSHSGRRPLHQHCRAGDPALMPPAIHPRSCAVACVGHHLDDA